MEEGQGNEGSNELPLIDPVYASIWKKTAFMFRGNTSHLMSSSEGMYGENRRSCMSHLVHLLKTKYQLNKDAVFLDIGSGRGVPNMVVATQGPIYASIGIELDEACCYLSMKHHIDLLNILMSLSIRNGTAEELLLKPKCPLQYHHMNGCLLTTFNPVTHVFSFDLALPPYMVYHFVNLFNTTASSVYYISFRKDLIEGFGMNATMVDRWPMSMISSGERHTCYIYKKMEGSASLLLPLSAPIAPNAFSYPTPVALMGNTATSTIMPDALAGNMATSTMHGSSFQNVQYPFSDEIPSAISPVSIFPLSSPTAPISPLLPIGLPFSSFINNLPSQELSPPIHVQSSSPCNNHNLLQSLVEEAQRPLLQQIHLTRAKYEQWLSKKHYGTNHDVFVNHQEAKKNSLHYYLETSLALPSSLPYRSKMQRLKREREERNIVLPLFNDYFALYNYERNNTIMKRVYLSSQIGRRQGEIGPLGEITERGGRIFVDALFHYMRLYNYDLSMLMQEANDIVDKINSAPIRRAKTSIVQTIASSLFFRAKRGERGEGRAEERVEGRAEENAEEGVGGESQEREPSPGDKDVDPQCPGARKKECEMATREEGGEERGERDEGIDFNFWENLLPTVVRKFLIECFNSVIMKQKPLKEVIKKYEELYWDEHWIQCDRCFRWRQVNNNEFNAEESVLKESNWYCEYNRDLRFRNCDIPGEISRYPFSHGMNGSEGRGEERRGERRDHWVEVKREEWEKGNWGEQPAVQRGEGEGAMKTSEVVKSEWGMKGEGEERRGEMGRKRKREDETRDDVREWNLWVSEYQWEKRSWRKTKPYLHRFYEQRNARNKRIPGEELECNMASRPRHYPSYVVEREEEYYSVSRDTEKEEKEERERRGTKTRIGEIGERGEIREVGEIGEEREIRKYISTFFSTYGFYFSQIELFQSVIPERYIDDEENLKSFTPFFYCYILYCLFVAMP